MQKKGKIRFEYRPPETAETPEQEAEPSEQPQSIPDPIPEALLPDEAPEAPADSTEEPAADSQPAEKRKPGRPKADPSKEPEDIWDVIARMKAGDKAYVYRMAPFTNKLMSGQRNVYIKIWDVPFDAEELLNYAGSGCYQIQFNEKQPDGSRKRTRIDDVKLLDMNRPPKIPPGEWVEDTKNKEWLWAKDAIFKPKEEPAPKSDPIIEMLNRQIERSEKQMDEMRKELRENANKKDPAEQSIFTALLNRVMQPTPAPPAPPDPMANLESIIRIAKAMQPPPLPPPGPSPFEEIAKKMVEAKLSGNDKGDFEKFLEFKAKFDEAAPVERRGKKDTWDHITETIDALGPVLGPALQPLGQALAMSMMGRPPQMQQQPHQPPPPYTPAAMPPPAQPTQQPSPTGPQAVQDRPSVPVFARAVLEGLKNSDKFTGLDLGDWYLKRWGAKEFADIQRQGKHEVIDLLKTGPTESWEPLKPYAEDGSLEELIEEFLEWEPDEPEQQQPKPQQQTAPAEPSKQPNWNNPAPVGVEVSQ